MTIKEVAARAGVSAAAVSRYLNGGPVSEEKKVRIRTVIEETGFQPSPMAQAMRTGRGTQIGVIAPKIDSESTAEILAGISEALKKENYATLLGVTKEDPSQEAQYIGMMQGQQVAGIVLMGTFLTEKLKEAVCTSTKPIVVTGQNFPQMGCVYHDDYRGMLALTKYILERGRRKIGYIGVRDEDAAAGKARYQGASDAWKEAVGEDGVLPKVTADGFDVKDGRAAMEKLLAIMPDLDSVVCATDLLAIGAMSVLRKCGKRIPEDVSVAGVGDSWVDEVLTPPLTSMHLPYRECGRIAAEMLLGMIHSRTIQAPESICLGYDIIERGTV